MVFSVVFLHAFKSSINVDSLQGLSVYFKTGISVYVSVYKHACVQGCGEGSRGVPLFSVPPHLIKETYLIKRSFSFVCGFLLFVCLFFLSGAWKNFKTVS